MSGHLVVTGAGGFVGSSLAAGFAALGWQVTAVDRVFDADARARLATADLVTVDLMGAAPAGLPAAQLVIHAAAVTTDHLSMGWTPASHIAANLRPLLSVLEYAARTRPEAFVFLSSSGVFAPEDSVAALADTDTPTAQSPYGLAKRAGERLVPAALAGATAAHVVRLGYVFGPHEAARPSRARVSLVAGWLAAARAGRPLEVTADNPRRDWTFAPDLAPALARLVDRPPAARAVHLGSPHVVSDGDLAAMIAGVVPASTIVTVPAAGVMKPPMAPSDIAALAGFAWTTPAAGLAALVASEAAA